MKLSLSTIFIRNYKVLVMLTIMVLFLLIAYAGFIGYFSIRELNTALTSTSGPNAAEQVIFFNLDGFEDVRPFLLR